jgi:proteasome lid subunit RPN8/RPN11
MLPLILATVLGCGDLCGDDARRAYADLLAAGGYGRLQHERAAFLVRVGDRITTQAWSNGSFQRVTFRGVIPEGTIAIAHTHPRDLPWPSAHDREEAKRKGIPIIVITPKAVVLTDIDGSVRTLLREPAWWER